jgi:methylenetetrahydrofolate dehydrogenase (NADP+) / methenyltetrahydrofolate cyclohydrolase
MSATILDGKAISQEILESIKQTVASLNPKPGLAVILVGNDPASNVYVSNKEKACSKVGFYSEKILLPENATPEELFTVIDRLNGDPKIHGILCQFPLPAALRHIEAQVILRINPDKDVDGFHPLSSLTPCTPKGVMALIDRAQIPIPGLHAVVMGRSHMVGKPAARLLLEADATVTTTHSKTVNLAQITRQADILVAAIGKANLVTTDMVKPGAIVIDVGINRTESGLVGDVDFTAVKQVAGFISPVPGGVGPMTIAMLMQNVLSAYQALNNLGK